MYPRPRLQPHSPMIDAYGSQSALPVIGNFSAQIMLPFFCTMMKGLGFGVSLLVLGCLTNA